MIAALALLSALLFAPDDAELRVSARSGDDANADGSQEWPFRSISAALLAARDAGVARVRVEQGTYDAAGGESFPLELFSGLHLVGPGSELGTIEGEAADVLVSVPGGEGTVVVSGLTLAGAGHAVESRTPAGADGALALALRDVALREAGVGLGVDLGGPGTTPGALSLRADGLRVARCGTGVAVSGSGRLELELESSSFEDCDVGLLLQADPGEDAARIGQADAPQYLRVAHTVVVRDTRFVGCRQAGVRREGADGKNDGPPYRFEDCLFQRNDVGLEMQRPCGDTGVVVERSRFLENVHFGLRVTGFAGAPERFSRVEDCDFRWNGVGVHLTCSNFVLSRCRVLDSVGNGVFSSNFLADPTTTVVTDSLIANNGASGFFSLADARLLTVYLVHSTIASNGYAGVYDKTRHSGSSRYEVRGCIVSGNALETEGLEPGQLFDSLVGRRIAGDDGGDDPGFVAPDLGDYHLRADSPCLDRGDDQGAFRAGETDLDGRPRREGAPDLGAFERSAG